MNTHIVRLSGFGWLVVLLALGMTLPTDAEVVCANENTAIIATTPTSDFVIIDDGNIVRHLPTRLEWQRCYLGQSWDGNTCQGTATTYTWQQALAAADAQSDWRLPKVNELASIIEERCWLPSLNSAIFPPSPLSGALWSSSPSVYHSGYAWRMEVGMGAINHEDKNTSNHHVRLVRGGQ